jgi:hypothetical protein
MQYLGALAEQVQDVLVAGDDAGRTRVMAGQLLVDGTEECGELACAPAARPILGVPRLTFSTPSRAAR